MITVEGERIEVFDAQRHLKLKIEDLRLIMAGNIKRLLKIR